MTSAFPTCRHRREPRHRTVYHCRSPKVAGLRLVTADFCGQCPFPDHHFPSEGDDAPCVVPDMSVEELALLIEGPSRAWPAGWEDWPVTREAHRLAADRFLAALPEYPAGDFTGRGIVIAGGGPRYFPSLYVTVRAIRHVGCDLPIQVWYLGREDELPAERWRLLEPFGVECVDADAVRERRPCRILNGWELKVYAVLHSPFAEVLSLDADCYPVRDPGFLFEDAGYRETGAVFWPDSVSGSPLDWRAFGVEPSGRASVESGQFVVDKHRSWRPLALAWWYNDHSDWSYLHGYGDMHTFDVAWARCGAAYRRFAEHADWHVHSFRHVGPDGRLLFVHRCRDKFRCGEQGYLSPQSFAANHFLPELPLEVECFAWRDELAESLGGGPPPRAAKERSVPTLYAAMITCPEREEVFRGTFARFGDTDWGMPPDVFLDAGEGPASVVRYSANSLRMLEAAADAGADYALLVEDDLLFNARLRHNVLHWPPVRDGRLWAGVLYNPGRQLRDGADAEVCARDRGAPAHLDHFWGAQAVVLSREALWALLREWEPLTPLDLQLCAAAARHGLDVLIHSPSLVQQLPIVSSLGCGAHRAVDYDPFFRA
jgi:hypothetical protein